MKNNGVIVVKVIDKKLAKEICLREHYSHKWNANFGTINFGIFRENNDECLGVAAFGNLMNPSSYSSIADDLKQNEIIELNRLWISDELGKNTETVFLSLCFKYIKHHYKEIKLIQSFADGRLGCGTIYKAANFNYYGYTKATFFEAKDNVYHRALLVDTRRLSTMAIMNLMLAKDMLKPFKVKSYRYIYVLDKRIESKIKLIKKDYPKYEKGISYIKDYKQALNAMCRVYVAFKIVNKEEFAEIIYSYIKKNYGDYTYEEIKEMSSSKNMDMFLNDESYQNKLHKGIGKIEEVLVVV